MNFLIHTGPGIGDMAQKLPMAKAIKLQFPDSQIDFLMKASEPIRNLNLQIIEAQNYVNNLYWYNVNDKLQCLKLLLQLRHNHYDYGFVRDGGMKVVSEIPSLWIFRIMRWGGCKKLVGFLKNYVDIFADVPERAHFIERDKLTLKAIGINQDLDPLTIDQSKTDLTYFNSFDRLRNSENIIALSVGTNDYSWTENGNTIIYDVKSWHYEKWLELALELTNLGYDVILMGGKKEKQSFNEKNISIPDNPKIFNFIGNTTLKQSLGVLSKCSLVVGAEGGMMHCAAALGIKTLTVFGGSDYKIWTPVNGDIISLNLDCSPCFSTAKAAHCNNHKCLDNISVKMVLDKIKSLL